jgi:Tfp pilus assembly protein PilN
MNMQQRINLYLYVKKTPTLFLTSHIIFILYGIFSVILLLDSAYSVFKKNELANEVNILSTELNNQKKNLERIKLTYPLVNLADLEGSTHRLREELTSKIELAGILSHQASFSAYMAALGNSITQGVWLTEIDIMQSGRKMTLHGMAVKAIFLQSFLEKLREHPLFSKMKFSLEDITQHPEDKKVSPLVEFTITAEAGEQL